MESLGTAIERVIDKSELLRTLRDQGPDLTDPEYIHRFLLDNFLPPTEQAAATLERLETLDAPGSQSDMADARRTLERCRQRDQLTVGRPNDCTCLGMGGRFRRYLGDGTEVLYFYCVCSIGQERAVKDNAARARFKASQQQGYAERLFAGAKVPSRFQGCTFLTYPESPESAPAVRAIEAWRFGPDDGDAARYEAWQRERRKSLLLHGKYGVGKTGLAVALLRDEIKHTGGGLFFTVPSLLDAIRSTYSPNAQHDEREIIAAVKDAPFLVLDDLGAERVTDWVQEKLFTVINHRHDEDLPTVFTSNLDLAQLAEHLGERTTWRIAEMAEVIEVKGPNLRQVRA